MNGAKYYFLIAYNTTAQFKLFGATDISCEINFFSAISRDENIFLILRCNQLCILFVNSFSQILFLQSLCCDTISNLLSYVGDFYQ